MEYVEVRGNHSNDTVFIYHIYTVHKAVVLTDRIKETLYKYAELSPFVYFEGLKCLYICTFGDFKTSTTCLQQHVGCNMMQMPKHHTSFK